MEARCYIFGISSIGLSVRDRLSHFLARMIDIIEATSLEELAIARVLLVEYEKDIGVDLCFQDFESELRGLPGAYAPPAGRLLLAMHDGSPVGCVALRAAGGVRAEMKRLYVRAAGRGLGIGRALVERALSEARKTGYGEVVLDTLPSMQDAQRMYERFGFRDIPPYRPNPVVGTRYLGKDL